MLNQIRHFFSSPPRTTFGHSSFRFRRFRKFLCRHLAYQLNYARTTKQLFCIDRAATFSINDHLRFPSYLSLTYFYFPSYLSLTYFYFPSYLSLTYFYFPSYLSLTHFYLQLCTKHYTFVYTR